MESDLGLEVEEHEERDVLSAGLGDEEESQEVVETGWKIGVCSQVVSFMIISAAQKDNLPENLPRVLRDDSSTRP